MRHHPLPRIFRKARLPQSASEQPPQHAGEMLFSTETCDAWLLDRTDLLAARLARDAEAAPIQIVETATTFAIEWTGSYRINGPAFVYSDRDTGRV